MADTQNIAPTVTSSATAGVAAHGFAEKTAHWIHQHPDATKSLPGYFAYHVARGAAAAVPYGISMGTTLGVMEGLTRAGDALAKSATKGSFKAGFGERLAQLTKFPGFRTSMLVATSFTLYRGTSKLGKFVHDQLFDPKDTEVQTAEKIRHMPQSMWAKIKDNAPAGIASTPVAAFVLGFVNATFGKGDIPRMPLDKAHPLADKAGLLSADVAKKEITLDWTRANFKNADKAGRGWELMGKTLTDRRGKFFEQAAIFTLGYSLFFEMADRLFKDRQIARGKWKADDSSINPGRTEGKDAAAHGEAPPKHHYGFFTDEPSLGRFAFRRMLPTAVSIGAYTAFKFRHSYMKMGDFVVKSDTKTVGEVAKDVPRLIAVETAAVLWFFMIPFVNEAWEKVYDRFFTKLEKKAAEKDGAAPVFLEAAKSLEQAPEKTHETPKPQVAHITTQGKAATADSIQQSVA